MGMLKKWKFFSFVLLDITGIDTTFFKTILKIPIKNKRKH